MQKAVLECGVLTISWRGPGPSSSLCSHLRQFGVQVAARRVAAESDLMVVATSSGEPPRAPDVESWVWLTSSEPSDASARRAVLSGAADVIAADDPNAAIRLAARCREVRARAEELPDTAGFVAVSRVARKVLGDVLRAARTSMPVLFTGETGTGKELAARLVHDWSRRRAKRFVPINCAAIPNELIEAELFGYVRGAFSGAIRDYDGQLMAAEEGTVFLDEIADTPPTLQAKLLRVLEDRVVSRLGQNEWHRIDFRLVAATNEDLKALIARGRFGEDLYDRLAILQITLPPLRERLEDLPALVEHFSERYFRDEQPCSRPHGMRGIAPSALRALCEYGWPGNVRELRNVVYESLLRQPEADELRLADLPRRILERRATPERTTLFDGAQVAALIQARSMNLRKQLEELERTALAEALRLSGGQPSKAAELLGEVGRGSAKDPAGTVRAMMRRLGLH